MTTDSDEIDARAKELFDLCSARICQVLDVTPTEAAAILYVLALDAMDAPTIAAPPSGLAGLSKAPRADVAEAPAAHFVMTGR